MANRTLQELFSSYSNYLREALHEVFGKAPPQSPTMPVPPSFDEAWGEWLHKAKNYIKAMLDAMDKLGLVPGPSAPTVLKTTDQPSWRNKAAFRPSPSWSRATPTPRRSRVRSPASISTLVDLDQLLPSIVQQCNIYKSIMADFDDSSHAASPNPIGVTLSAAKPSPPHVACLGVPDVLIEMSALPGLQLTGGSLPSLH